MIGTFSRFDTNHPCDRQTDKRTDRRADGIGVAYTRYSIYAVARKNSMSANAKLRQSLNSVRNNRAVGRERSGNNSNALIFNVDRRHSYYTCANIVRP